MTDPWPPPQPAPQWAPPPAPPAYGYGGPPPAPPGWQPVPPAAPPYGYGPPAGWAPPPPPHLQRAAGALAAVPWLMWALALAYLLTLVNGIVALATADEGYSSSTYETGESIGIVGVLLFIGVGAAIWALLALWCSHTSLAARQAGNLPSGSSVSHIAWWGVFVPVGYLFLPFLAYREAARHTSAVAAHGQLRNAGEGWRQAPLPPRMLPWWVTWAVATLLYSVYMGVSGYGWYTLEGLLMLTSGVIGIGASVLGALVFRDLAARARTAAAPR